MCVSVCCVGCKVAEANYAMQYAWPGMHEGGGSTNASGLTTVVTSLRSFINVAFQDVFPSKPANHTNCSFKMGDYSEGHSLDVGGVALPYCSPCKRIWKLPRPGSWFRQIGYVSASRDTTIVQEGNSN